MESITREKITFEAKQKRYKIEIGMDGKVEIPVEVLMLLGAEKGDSIEVRVRDNKIEILPNIHGLVRVYIEPTSRCNLACLTCVRNTWDEKMGDMELSVFNSIIEQLKVFNSLQSIMFGAFGEPLSHKDILYMIRQAKSLGVKVEMTTNGTLLDEPMIRGLLDSGLDTLWVSFDGTEETSFEDIRYGASFKCVVENLKLLRKLRRNSKFRTEIGIAFVAMKQNIDELKNVNKLAKRIGAKKVSISNVLPYSEELQEQILYNNTIQNPDAFHSEVSINLPKIDINETTIEVLSSLIRHNHNISILSNRLDVEGRFCRFIKDRCTFIRWDGMVSPCMGLIHSCKTHMNNYQRSVEAYTLGDVSEKSISEIWNSKEYYEFREKVNEFDFSPCNICGGCNNMESNKEDCFGNKYPTCGACLWACGIIQCP